MQLTKKDLFLFVVVCILGFIIGLFFSYIIVDTITKETKIVEVSVEHIYFETEVKDIEETSLEESEKPEEAPTEETAKTEEVSEEVYYEEPAKSYSYQPVENYSGYSNTSGLTKSGGVNYYNGRKETYYSSNVLQHNRISEWAVGSDGVYRDSEGYVIVAASDLNPGSTIDTSFGVGKVYDTGCPSGVTDIYTNW